MNEFLQHFSRIVIQSDRETEKLKLLCELEDLFRQRIANIKVSPEMSLEELELCVRRARDQNDILDLQQQVVEFEKLGYRYPWRDIFDIPPRNSVQAWILLCQVCEIEKHREPTALSSECFEKEKN